MRFTLSLCAAAVSALITGCGGGDVTETSTAAATPAATQGQAHAMAVTVTKVVAPNKTVTVAVPKTVTTTTTTTTTTTKTTAPVSTTPTDAQRTAAATATANSSSNACAAAKPFYWEIGNAAGRVASGSVASTTSTVKYTATSTMQVASASKWLYAAYVVQRQNGKPTDLDIKHLTMRSGYASFQTCLPNQSVDSCLAYSTNGAYSSQYDGIFNYNGGHAEKHASLISLGVDNNKMLASAMQSQLGTDVSLTYSQPQLAGGAVMSPDAYARVLRKMLGGQLKIGALLGSNAVCTNSTTCSTAAPGGPIPNALSWHYSLGHWVEDDPKVGDGAFSSLGLFGFYPWIDAKKTTYGLLARDIPAGGTGSATCGGLIRRAWATGLTL